MKRLICTVSLLGLTTVSIANPTLIAVKFICPSATGAGLHTLARFNGHISGYGTETLNNTPAFNSPLFSYSVPAGANIPMSLSSYSNSGTSFDFATGLVSCSFASSGPFSPFTTTYQMTNVAGGQVAVKTVNSIIINQYIGLN
jgi:hypothetical protein